MRHQWDTSSVGLSRLMPLSCHQKIKDKIGLLEIGSALTRVGEGAHHELTARGHGVIIGHEHRSPGACVRNMAICPAGFALQVFAPSRTAVGVRIDIPKDRQIYQP